MEDKKKEGAESADAAAAAAAAADAARASADARRAATAAASTTTTSTATTTPHPALVILFATSHHLTARDLARAKAVCKGWRASAAVAESATSSSAAARPPPRGYEGFDLAILHAILSRLTPLSMARAACVARLWREAMRGANPFHRLVQIEAAAGTPRGSPPEVEAVERGLNLFILEGLCASSLERYVEWRRKWFCGFSGGGGSGSSGSSKSTLIFKTGAFGQRAVALDLETGRAAPFAIAASPAGVAAAEAAVGTVKGLPLPARFVKQILPSPHGRLAAYLVAPSERYFSDPAPDEDEDEEGGGGETDEDDSDEWQTVEEDISDDQGEEEEEEEEGPAAEEQVGSGDGEAEQPGEAAATAAAAAATPTATTTDPLPRAHYLMMAEAESARPLFCVDLVGLAPVDLHWSNDACFLAFKTHARVDDETFVTAIFVFDVAAALAARETGMTMGEAGGAIAADAGRSCCSTPRLAYVCRCSPETVLRWSPSASSRLFLSVGGRRVSYFDPCDFRTIWHDLTRDPPPTAADADATGDDNNAAATAADNNATATTGDNAAAAAADTTAPTFSLPEIEQFYIQAEDVCDTPVQEVVNLNPPFQVFYESSGERVVLPLARPPAHPFLRPGPHDLVVLDAARPRAALAAYRSWLQKRGVSECLPALAGAKNDLLLDKRAAQDAPDAEAVAAAAAADAANNAFDAADIPLEELPAELIALIAADAAAMLALADGHATNDAAPAAPPAAGAPAFTSRAPAAFFSTAPGCVDGLRVLAARPSGRVIALFTTSRLLLRPTTVGAPPAELHLLPARGVGGVGPAAVLARGDGPLAESLEALVLSPGGGPELGAFHSPRWSPCGRRLMFVAQEALGPSCRVIVLELPAWRWAFRGGGGGKKKKKNKRPPKPSALPRRMILWVSKVYRSPSSYHLHSKGTDLARPVWSPDGRAVCFPAYEARAALGADERGGGSGATLAQGQEQEDHVVAAFVMRFSDEDAAGFWSTRADELVATGGGGMGARAGGNFVVVDVGGATGGAAAEETPAAGEMATAAAPVVDEGETVVAEAAAETEASPPPAPPPLQPPAEGEASPPPPAPAAAVPTVPAAETPAPPKPVFMLVLPAPEAEPVAWPVTGVVSWKPAAP